MKHEIQHVKLGLGLVFFGLIFGLGLGVILDLYEGSLKDFVQIGVMANPNLHDNHSTDKIWAYATQARINGIGVSAISLGLILLIMATPLQAVMKSLTATLIGLINLYPLIGFTLFLLAPNIGCNAAQSHWLITLFSFTSILGSLSGIALLFIHIYFGAFHEDDEFEDNYRKQIVEYEY